MGAIESKEAGKKASEEEDIKLSDNDFQLVFEAIKEMEYTLIAHFESSGDNLHEMISTTNQKLPLELIVDMRELATIRNNMAHEYGIDKLADRKSFVEKYRRCIKKLRNEIQRRKEEDEKFYKEVVQRHRQLHPRPTLAIENDLAADTSLQNSPFSCVACF